MRAHTFDASALLQAISCLLNLIHGSDINLRLVLNNNGVETILGALQVSDRGDAAVLGIAIIAGGVVFAADADRLSPRPLPLPLPLPAAIPFCLFDLAGDNLASCLPYHSQSHDWDHDLVSGAVGLLQALVQAQPAVAGRLVELRGHRDLLGVMETHNKRPRVLTAVCRVLTEIVAEKPDMAAALYAEAVPAILKAVDELYDCDDMDFDEGDNDEMDGDDDDDDFPGSSEGGRGSFSGGQARVVMNFLAGCMDALVAFTASDAANQCIAEDGMHILVNCMNHYFEVPQVLEGIFSLLGYLTFVEDNLRAIVQYSGIEAILLAISTNPESGSMIIKVRLSTWLQGRQKGGGGRNEKRGCGLT